jgi:hypothetical protein
VPREADEDRLEQYRLQLERELGTAEKRCQEILSHSGHR